MSVRPIRSVMTDTLGSDVVRSYSGYVNSVAEALEARDNAIRETLVAYAVNKGVTTREINEVMNRAGLSVLSEEADESDAVNTRVSEVVETAIEGLRTVGDAITSAIANLREAVRA